MSGKTDTAIIAIIIAFGLLASGFLWALPDAEPEEATGLLPTFESQHQLTDFIRNTQDNGKWSILSPEMSAGQASSADQVRHSTTNVQVEGIDEADCVKTDGDYLYIATYETISIIKAYPPGQLSNSSSINIRDALDLGDNYSTWIQGIYLLEGRLVVVASVCGPYDYSGYSESDDYKALSPALWRTPEERSVVAVFSISQTDPPLLIGWAGTSGYSVTSRMSGNVVYLVAQDYIWMYDNDLSPPKEWDQNGATAIPATSIHYDPQCNDPASFLNILAVDAASMESELASILTGYASTIYVSQEAMYLTFQKWVGSSSDSTIEPFMDADQSVQVAISSDSVMTTVYKVALEGLTLKPLARGEVPGYLLNQFSLDERDGLLRVATTFSWENQRSAVYVLNDTLAVIGSLEDLAPGERIYSSRFIDDTLFLVTFRQVDPLFVIDLSDPTHPKVVGELKVPGFSSYLHPVGDGRLVGIGMENGTVKISLFDVSDPQHPGEIDTVLVPGWSQSEALWDHKAVTFDEVTGSLIIPVTAWDNITWNCTSGAYVFVITPDDVQLKGVVEPEGGEYVMRAQYIGDYLYTISQTTVYVHTLNELDPVTKLIYGEPFYNFVPILMAQGDVAVIGAFR